VEIGKAQPICGDTVQCGCWNNSAESGGRSEADIVGHDEDDVGCAFRRHDTGWPCLFRLVEVETNDTLERLRGGGK